LPPIRYQFRRGSSGATPSGSVARPVRPDAYRDGQSNSVENLARPIALSRKSALIAGRDEGAAAWGRIVSLIEMVKLNGVEPYDTQLLFLAPCSLDFNTIELAFAKL